MRIATKLNAAIALVMVAVVPQVSGAANGLNDTGNSARDMGRGGAFIAVETGPSALSGNPAALAFSEEEAVEVDLRVFNRRTLYEGALNGRASERTYIAPSLSYAAPLSDRWAWGVGVFSLSNAEFEVRDFDLSVVGAPPGALDGASSKVFYMAVTPGFAYKLDNRTSIGASVHWSSGATSDQAYDIFGSTMGQRLSGLSGEGYSVRAGLYHRANDETTWGAYWRSRSHLSVGDGTLELAPGNPLGGGLSIDGVEVSGVDFPEEYGVGVAHRFNCNFLGTAEYRRINWAAVRQNIVIAPPGQEPIVFPQRWVNQDVFVLGGEYYPDGTDCTAWRAGVNYAASPVTDESVSPIFAATNKLHVSGGFERQIGERTRFVLGTSYSPANKQTSTDTNPYNAMFGAGMPFTTGTSDFNIGLGLKWSLGSKSGGYCDCCDGCHDVCRGGSSDVSSEEEHVEVSTSDSERQVMHAREVALL